MRRRYRRSFSLSDDVAPSSNYKKRAALRSIAVVGAVGAIGLAIWETTRLAFTSQGAPGSGGGAGTGPSSGLAPSNAPVGSTIQTQGGGNIKVTATAPAAPTVGTSTSATVTATAQAAAQATAGKNQTLASGASPTQAALQIVDAVLQQSGGTAPATITPAVQTLYGESQRDLLTFGDGSQASVMVWQVALPTNWQKLIPNSTDVIVGGKVLPGVLVQVHGVVTGASQVQASAVFILSAQKG